MASMALSQDQFNAMVRMVKIVTYDRVASIATATGKTLSRLGVRRNRRKLVAGMPAGSDQVNIGAIIDWLGRVAPGDKGATMQVLALDATALARMAG